MAATRLTRRTFTATGVAVATGVFIPLRGVQAEVEGTPQPVEVSQGFVSTRVRTVASAEARDEINGIVLEDFIPEVRQLDGYGGYLLGNVVENEAQSLSIVVLEQVEQSKAFDALAADFVEDLGEMAESLETVQWAGDLLISGVPVGEAATPALAEGDAPMRSGFVTLRVHISAPGTDPRDFVPLATTGFLPVVQELEGFRGYLWYPIENGWVSASLFESVESAEAYHEVEDDWAEEFIAEYVDGESEVFNAHIVWAEFPALVGV